MSENRKILVVIEPDNHPHEVVERASWLAELTGSDLHLLLCDPNVNALSLGIFVSNEARDIARHIREAQQEMIEEIAQPARDRGINVTTDVLEERPVADAILQLALETEPRYVVKGTEYHSVAERAIFVDTDWQLIRTCPFPLWLVKAREFGKKPMIIAAVDPVHSHDKPAALDQLIVDRAKEIGGPAKGEIHLFHTYESIVSIGREATKTFKPIELPVDELTQKIEAEHLPPRAGYCQRHRRQTRAPTAGKHERPAARLRKDRERRCRRHGCAGPLGPEENDYRQHCGEGTRPPALRYPDRQVTG